MIIILFIAIGLLVLFNVLGFKKLYDAESDFWLVDLFLPKNGKSFRNSRNNATLSRTRSDQIRSKLLAPGSVQLVLDVSMTPQEYARIVDRYFHKAFVIEIREVQNKEKQL